MGTQILEKIKASLTEIIMINETNNYENKFILYLEMQS